jgi:putative transposase
MITDKLASYPAAKKELMPHVEHRRHKGLNNRAERPFEKLARPGSDEAERPCRRFRRG